MLKRALKILANKYTITAVLFLLLMLFFDQNDWFTQHERETELRQTQEKIDHLNGEVVRMEKELNDLNGSNARLEQYAREKYHEKRDGEDVYLIVPDSGKAPVKK
ncbi:FtsB family cell division protein [Taibaiella koreensis]|uniref:FtsB family cell division protein n=1 Tax=Taibaiella koreensis TaxID=1268548 RepID=UPI000E59D62F|nr:septum formation initiator family protein [Taibaiella koreensis]